MPIYGRALKTSNSIVSQLPTLPYPLYNGSISWSDSFDSNISGSIEYQDVCQEEVDAIEAAYPLGLRFTGIYGFPFEVERVSSDETDFFLEGDIEIYTYTVSVSLTGYLVYDLDPNLLSRAENVGYISYVSGALRSLVSDVRAQQSLDQVIAAQKQQINAVFQAPDSKTNTYQVTSSTSSPNRVPLKPPALIEKPRGWVFSKAEILKNGPGEKAIDTDGYNQSELTFKPSEKTTSTGKKTVFIPKEPVIKTVVEESDKLYEPPENTTVLRDDSSCFDKSGEKKTRKETTTVDGKPFSDRLLMTGFAYLQSDIYRASTDELLSYEPGKFWKVVDDRKTIYVYQKPGSITLKIRIVPPGGTTFDSMKFIIHPDYEQFAQISGENVIMTTNAEFLVEGITRGTQLARLYKEDDTHSSLDPDSYFPYLQFQSIPYEERTASLLKPSRGLFGEKIEPPFKIEFSSYESLEPRIKERFSSSDATSDGRVAILIPDPNYVEPLYVAVEATYANSFIWANDPDADEPDPVDPGSKPSPPKRLTTGQETRNETRRTLLAADFYSEAVKEFSAQDANFENSVEKIYFREVAGTPPEATYKIRSFEQKEIDVTPSYTAGNANIKYFITTTDNADRLEVGGNSVSINNVKTINEALDAVKVRLRKAKMQSVNNQKLIAWFHPDIRAGDPVTCEGDRFTNLGTWRVNSVSWRLDYKGTANLLQQPLVTTPGTQLTLGLDADRSIRVETKPGDNVNNAAQEDPTIDISLTGGTGEIGVLLPNAKNRRNF